MIDNPALQQIINQESLLELWVAMTPEQQVVAVLRMERLTFDQIGAVLGITAEGARHRLHVAAKQRILERLPHLREELGRGAREKIDRRRRDGVLPLEYGYIISTKGDVYENSGVGAGDCPDGGSAAAGAAGPGHGRGA